MTRGLSLSGEKNRRNGRNVRDYYRLPLLLMGEARTSKVTGKRNRPHHTAGEKKAVRGGRFPFPLGRSGMVRMSLMSTVVGMTLLAWMSGGNDRSPVPAPSQVADESGWVSLFNGKDLTGWKMAGPGHFTIEHRALRTHGGMGLLWYNQRPFRDFILQVEWKVTRQNDNSGIFVRFPDPGNDPWIAVRQGHEIQIQDDRDPIHRTGAIYNFAPSSKVASKPAGQWNLYEIRVVGKTYTVTLNGETVCQWEDTEGRPLEGYIGLQNHDENSIVYFRNIRVRELKGN